MSKIVMYKSRENVHDDSSTFIIHLENDSTAAWNCKIVPNFIPKVYKIYPSVLHFAKQLKIEIFLALMKIHQGSDMNQKFLFLHQKNLFARQGLFWNLFLFEKWFKISAELH